MQINFKLLTSQLEGDLFTDNVQHILYSTDASHYMELPKSVIYSKN